MANERIVKITILGDSAPAQQSLRQLGESSASAEVKVEGFGKAFLKAGAALGVGAAAVGAVVGVMRAAIDAVGDYNTSIDQSSKLILGFTKSQQAVAAATALARKEADAGHGTYQETLASLAALTPLSNKYNLSLEDVLHTTQLLAASDPVQGFEGAKIAIQEALSGDFTSLSRRFELPKNAIQELKDQGVPNLQIVQKVLADLGIDQKFLDTANTSNAKTIDLAKGAFTEFAAVLGKPIFDKFIEGVTLASKAASGGGGKSFAAALADEIRVIVNGRLFDQFGVDVLKVFFLIGDAFDGLLKTISGGKLNIDGPLKEFYQQINGLQSEITAAVNKGAAQPVADTLSGKAPNSPLAPAKMQGYGSAVVAEYVKGLTSAQIGDFDQFTKKIGDLFAGGFKDASGKENAEQLAAATSDIAQALKEVAQDGQISETTLFRLSTVFGKNTDEVQRLVIEYGRMGAAQDHAKATTDALAQAQGNLARVTAQSANAAAAADKTIAAAQSTATQHSQEATAALDAQHDALKGVGDAAAEAARRNTEAIDGLQATAAAHAEANQAAIAAAQAAQTAATEQRQRDSAIAQAAIRGETDAYLRQTDALTEQDRKLAEHYETIIGGERRAKDAAGERLNGLNKAANKEDLDFLTRIQAARQGGHAKEANALQRQYDARKKQRGSEIEIARAQSAVAGDEYDTVVDQIDKEVKKKDEADATAEKEAGKRLKEVQANADAQAKADAAAIKGVQDAAKEEADRYAAQQRGIQVEIDRLNDAAKVQATKDAAAILAAQNLKTETALKWSIEEIGAKTALGLANNIATANERTAKAAKEHYDWLVAMLPYAQGVATAAQAAAAAGAKIPAYLAPTSGGTQGDDNGQNNGAPGNGAPSGGGTGGGGTKPKIFDGTGKSVVPDGYHRETEPSTQTIWFVPDGYTLSDYGKTGYPTSQPGGSSGGSDSLGRTGGASLLESGTPATASAGGGDIHLHINAPNLTDIGNPAQQRALAAQVGNEGRRVWGDIVAQGDRSA